jgi:hypothetical protein
MMFAAALPFIWIGLLLVARRLRSVGGSQKLLFLFFLPVVNLLFFATLAALPARPVEEATPSARSSPRRPSLEKTRESSARWFASAARAVAAAVIAATLACLFSVSLLRDYGAALFIGSPFVAGLLVALLHGYGRHRGFGETLALAWFALLLVAGSLLLLAFEGGMCLVMSLPIALVLALIGVVVGRRLSPGPVRRRAACFAPVAALPLLIAAEAWSGASPPVRRVVSRVEVAAPIETVWSQVVAFPPLPEPTEWWFRTGIAYPIRAEISGQGVGAIRRCVFSTGAFVEPIVAWDEPNRLAFDVTEQPPPMVEWSPWSISPPHLDGFLRSEHGEFRLVALADGSTELIGTTWYTDRMRPQWYWGLWSDALIHRIHLRVLEHVRRLAEAQAG